MKVKDLIEQLKQFDGELEVWVDNDGRLEEADLATVQGNGLHSDFAYDVVFIR
jgi:hypothetical protein